MKSVKRYFFAMMMVSSMLTMSCEKEQIEEVIPESNSMSVGQYSVSSFTANLTGTFDGVDKTDLVMGKRGVLYGIKSDKTESAFKEWQKGNDNPECIIVDKADFQGASMKCAVNGLVANTEYSYCLFLQKRDGSREISSVSSFKTQPFAPEMKNLDVKGVECFVAFAEGKVLINEKDASYCELGVLASQETNANINNSMVFKQKGVYNSTVTARLNGLESDKHYYCRLYVKYPGANGQSDYVYGESVIIRTKAFEEVAVDLGLSVYWASYNVGASAPEEFGNYYSWGELAPKTNYTWDTFKWKGNMKYCTDTLSTNLTSLKMMERADDAANYNWGGNWQIATDAVFGELHDNCDIDFYAEINGVKGKRFTSRINGNSIFIPYSGFLRYNSVPNGVGNMFLFFLRDLYFCQATYGFYIGWGLTKQNHYDYTPWDGVSVRPVYPKE